MTDVFRPVILGGFGPPVLACLRSWRRQSWEPGLIAVQGDGEKLPASRQLSRVVRLPREQLYTRKGVEIIDRFLREFRASGLICIDENVAVWLNENRELLPSDLGWWIPSTPSVKRVLSKIDQIEAARQVGFDLLPTYSFDAGKPLPPIQSAHFPLCLRPSRPGSTEPGFKVKNVLSLNEAEEFLASLTEMNSPVLGQPFTNLANFVVHGVRTTKGENIGLEGFLVPRKFEGVTLTLKPAELSTQLKEQCIAFTEALEIVGNYHFEFLVDPGSERYYFLEINYRFGGTTAKAYACGYDEPALALAAFGYPYTPKSELRNVTASSRKALAKYFTNAMIGRLTSLDYPEENRFLRMANALIGMVAYRDDVFSWNDLTGSLSLYFNGFGLPRSVQRFPRGAKTRT